jgi:LMBR1 domain-containing protein 1
MVYDIWGLQLKKGLEYRRVYWLQEATDLGKRAREVKEAAAALQREERSGSKGRKWRKNVKAVEKV